MENTYQLSLNVRMSARYHSLCERWYLKLNKLVTFVNLISGSAVLGTVLAKIPNGAIASGFAVTLLAAFDFTLGTAQKAVLHRDLHRRYLQLDAEIARDKLDEAAIIDRTRAIEVDELPVIEAFRIFSYNQNLAAHGHQELLRLKWSQRLMLSLV